MCISIPETICSRKSRSLKMRQVFVLCLCIWAISARAQRAPAPAANPSWKTLSGTQPLIIANGGQSGLYPDQTLIAYNDALQKTAGGTALFCDLQLSKDGQGICRTNIDLKASTSIDSVFPNSNKTYVVNGVRTTGYFSIDFTINQLINNITARQSSLTRPADFDGQNLLSPDQLAQLLVSYTNATGLPGYMWLNIEYAKFYEEHKINMTAYAFSAINSFAPAFISSTEVGILRKLRPQLSKTKTKTFLRIPDILAVEPTTNQTYGSLLSNMTNIKALASGILISKDLIWPTGDNGYLETPTTLVLDAHRQKLEVHAFLFQNDFYPSSFNYSYDPIKELLYFVNGPNFSVDGVLTDFPTTASLAIECFANQAGARREATDKTVFPPFTGKQVITHSGGDSGNYPGSTRLSYMSAIDKGADYIDCPVQMTKDGVAICRQSPDLLLSTNVAVTDLSTRTKTVKSFQDEAGVFTFELTWNEISTLKAQMVSPQREQQVFRNTGYDGSQSILKLSDFLSIAKSTPKVGIYLVLQKAYLLNGTLGVDTVAAVASALKDAGLNNKSSNVVIQSEDAAVLRSLRDVVSADLIYFVSTAKVSLTDSVLKEIKEFAGGVAVPKALVSPSANSFLTPITDDVVSRVHNHSLSLLVVFFRNEFVSIPFDFLADPTLELNTYVQSYKVDGIVTDFPETASAYLSNRCLRSSSTQSFQIPTIVPGLLVAPPPQGAPFPPLSVAEPPLAGFAPAPAPVSTKNSALNTIPELRLLLTTCLVLQLILSWQRLF